MAANELFGEIILANRLVGENNLLTPAGFALTDDQLLFLCAVESDGWPGNGCVRNHPLATIP